MQTTIKHACGHDETVQLYGSREERERREKWLDGKPCRECERTTATARAQQQAEAQRLRELTGSEKQVAWAERIRAERLSNVDDLLRQIEAREARGVLSAEQLAEKADILARDKALRQQVSASWWIDHRTATSKELLRGMEAR